MKTLNESFTDQEWLLLKEVKDFTDDNWHDFILRAALAWVSGYYDKDGKILVKWIAAGCMPSLIFKEVKTDV